MNELTEKSNRIRKGNKAPFRHLLHHYVPSDIGYHVYKKQNQVYSTNVKINVENIIVKTKGTKRSTRAFFDFILP